MELPTQLLPALEEIRDRMLGAPGFPLPEEERHRIRDYRLVAAGPGEATVRLSVESEAGAAASGEGAGDRTRERELELTPQVVVDSPRGYRYFAAWNHGAGVFAIWFTEESLEAFRQEVAAAHLNDALPGETPGGELEERWEA